MRFLGPDPAAKVTDDESVVVALTKDEVLALANSLGEAMAVVGERHFHSRIGVLYGQAGQLRRELASALDAFPQAAEAVSRWETLKEIYIDPRSAEYREELAVELAASASQDQIEELVEVARMEELGSSRARLLATIGSFGSALGISFLESLVGHPMLGAEARRVLADEHRS